MVNSVINQCFVEACLWTFTCRTAVWNTENKKHATLNLTTRCLSLSVFSDWISSCGALHMNNWKCINVSSYLLKRLKISCVVNHTTALLSFSVYSALETVWSCMHQAPSTGTTSAAEHRTATYACTVGFILLQEGTWETWMLYLFVFFFAHLSNVTHMFVCLKTNIFLSVVICADSTIHLLWDYYPAWS